MRIFMAAAIAALQSDAAAGQTYDVGGGERLTYREMIGRIFDETQIGQQISNFRSIVESQPGRNLQRNLLPSHREFQFARHRVDSIENCDV